MNLEICDYYIPFGKPDFSGGEVDAVAKVMQSGWVGMGQETICFEGELAQFTGAQHVVSVNSCTSALTLSLLVAGVGKADEVICPSLTWCSTANAVIYLGAVPIFCDVDPSTYCVTEESILAKLTNRTKAVIAVHFGGLALDVFSLRRALPKNIILIEDAAHALGANYPNGSPVGSSGNLTCFSFYANKNISTGEGGGIAVGNDELASRLRSLRLHGLNSDAWKRFSNPKVISDPNVSELGYKMNFTDLQASIGRVQLRRMREFDERRLLITKYYKKYLAQRECDLFFQDNVVSKYHARHLFTVLLPIEKMKISRNDFLIEMRNRMVGVSIHYAPLHKMNFYKELSSHTTLKATDFVAERIVTLPISASMTLNDAEYVTLHFNDLLRKVLNV
jgi:perosamine synthetase